MATFDKDRDEVIRRAKASGVTNMIVSGYDSISNHRALRLGYNCVFITLGLSPNMRVGENIDYIKDQIKDNADRIVAIGEIGLDRVKSKLPVEKQKKIFLEFLDLAEELKKPVVIHARESEVDVLNILKKYDLKCMFHCFSGNVKAMRAAQDNGYLISLSTMVCFSKKHQQLASKVDLENLVIESDSPFLSPKRGRNEPANVIYALKEIAVQRESEEKDVVNAVAENARRFFEI
jgi:TatD DNase family protein